MKSLETSPALQRSYGVWDLNRFLPKRLLEIGDMRWSAQLLQFAGTATLLLSVCGCEPTAPQAGPPANKPSERPQEMSGNPVTVSAVNWPQFVRTQGSFVADEVTEIGVEVPGIVAEVTGDLGDRVEAGTVLMKLNQEQYLLDVEQAQAQLQQARAAVGLSLEDSMAALTVENAPPVRQERALWDEAKARLKRANRLNSNDAITQETVETAVAEEQAAEARYLSACNSVREKIATVRVRQAEVDLAQSRLSKTIIRAPFSGEILRRNVTQGTYLSSGDSLMTLVRSNPIWFRGTIPERYAQQLQLGQKIRIRLALRAEPLEASISRISPVLDELSRALTYEVRIDNPDAQLRTGLFAEGEILLNSEATAIAIPQDAVREFAGVERVTKLFEGKPVEQIIDTGERRDGQVEITSGLATGDIVLIPSDS